jgi:hypothetical protein
MRCFEPHAHQQVGVVAVGVYLSLPLLGHVERDSHQSPRLFLLLTHHCLHVQRQILLLHSVVEVTVGTNAATLQLHPTDSVYASQTLLRLQTPRQLHLLVDDVATVGCVLPNSNEELPRVGKGLQVEDLADRCDG